LPLTMVFLPVPDQTGHGSEDHHRRQRYRQTGMTDTGATRAGMRARSYHASPGEVTSVGGGAPGVWMNCVNTLDDSAVPEGMPGESPQQPTQLPVVRWIEAGQGSLGVGFPVCLEAGDGK